MTYSPCDYMDDVNEALGVHMDTECVQTVAGVAILEIHRLKRCEKRLKEQMPAMERMLYYVSPESQQLDWDEDGPVDKSLFVYAKDASEAIKLWRGYYDLEDEESPLGKDVRVRVHEVPIMPPMADSTAIGWTDVHTFGATETERGEL
ncbi:hypothetical protein ACTG4Q_20895 [Bradyrhizobium denitrificans]